MADAISPPSTDSAPDLKYLGFFRVAVVKALVILTSIYQYLKDSSGILKPGLDKVEGTVQAVVGPVYTKLEGKPDEFLAFVDKKVDIVLTTAHKFIPGFVQDTAKSAHENTRAVYTNLAQKGVYEAGKGFYSQAQPVVADYAYAGWKLLLEFPLAPQLITLVAPVGLYGASKYNNVADYLQQQNISVVKSAASYLPKVPVEEFERTVQQDCEAALKGSKAS